MCAVAGNPTGQQLTYDAGAAAHLAERLHLTYGDQRVCLRRRGERVWQQDMSTSASTTGAPTDSCVLGDAVSSTSAQGGDPT